MVQFFFCFTLTALFYSQSRIYFIHILQIYFYSFLILFLLDILADFIFIHIDHIVSSHWQIYSFYFVLRDLLGFGLNWFCFGWAWFWFWWGGTAVTNPIVATHGLDKLLVKRSFLPRSFAEKTSFRTIHHARVIETQLRAMRLLWGTNPN